MARQRSQKPKSKDQTVEFEHLISTTLEDEPILESSPLATEAVAVVSALAVTESATAAKEELKQMLQFGPSAGFESLSDGADPSANIVGIALAEKYEEGFPTARLAVQVMVKRKLPNSAIDDALQVPPMIGNFPTDVVEVGEIWALPTVVVTASAQAVFTNRNRPAVAGDSIGHGNVTAGTLGCLVNAGGKLCILSNNHVLANVNQASNLDPIVQSGRADGGRDPQDRIARLLDFERISFAGNNRIDAAIAGTQPTVVGRGSRAGYNIGSQPTTPFVGMGVRKCGRTTGHTVGSINSLSADVRVNYTVGGQVRSAFFDDQIQIIGSANGFGGRVNFSEGGDSGSVIVERTSFRPVGLLFAGGSGVTFANPINLVIQRFNIQEFLG
jgi:hypothetical protein